jgi:hypothetical protein
MLLGSDTQRTLRVNSICMAGMFGLGDLSFLLLQYFIGVGDFPLAFGDKIAALLSCSQSNQCRLQLPQGLFASSGPLQELRGIFHVLAPLQLLAALFQVVIEFADEQVPVPLRFIVGFKKYLDRNAVGVVVSHGRLCASM